LIAPFDPPGAPFIGGEAPLGAFLLRTSSKFYKLEAGQTGHSPFPEEIDMCKKAIRVQDLTREFQSRRALNGISFSVAPGEIFGFLGPNGAGKTTTIRILTGQLRPTSGSAWVMGYDVVTQRASLKSLIGVVFEVQNLYIRLSARQNLIFSANLYGVPKYRVDQVLEQVGLTPRADERLKAYSNGMRQRLLIARALLHQPRVLFLDEPTRGLDPKTAREIRAFVAGLAQQGVTIFLTTHYMEEADQLCSRVAILNAGRIIALDKPGQLKQDLRTGADTTLEDVFIELTGRSLVTA
jgi:ABC-2 type transport system ATP-binding protein